MSRDIPASDGQAGTDAGLADRVPLRFITCGSVDDGKSTLIGRLLYEQNMIFDDQLATLTRDSAKHGTTGEAMDFALLVDGLEAEREQGITIDVAYRYFRTARRSFIVADTPGHEQYTRNMATGASNADLAVLLVDARKGLLTQTHRHATIAALLGIRQVVLAVNKIDLVGYAQRVFDDIVAAFTEFAARLAFTQVTAIPLSARNGDNLSTRSSLMPWYTGPSLLEHLETVGVADERANSALRLPVQWVNRPNLDFRGFAGTLASGRVAPGDEIMVAGSGRASRVLRIVAADGDRPLAEAGDAITLVLADEVDVARGDVLCSPRDRPDVADNFTADLIWMSEDPLRFGRSYLLKLGTRTLPATISALAYRLDIDSFVPEPATTLRLNEVGRVTLAASAPLAFDPFARNAATGAFILIDRESNATIAAGTVQAGPAVTPDARGHRAAVTRVDRARIKHQRPGVVWFTGPPEAGTSAIAAGVESRLNLAGVHTATLDEADLRRGLCKDLGLTAQGRAEHIRRAAEVARLMADAGLIVLCCIAAPLRAERAAARATLPAGEFVEIHVDTPLAARGGESAGEADGSQPYEPPVNPEAVVCRDGESLEQATASVLDMLVAGGFIDRYDDLVDWSI